MQARRKVAGRRLSVIPEECRSGCTRCRHVRSKWNSVRARSVYATRAFLAWTLCVSAVAQQELDTRDLSPLLQSVESWDSDQARMGWSWTLTQAPRMYRV